MNKNNEEKLNELKDISDMIRTSYIKLEKLEIDGKQNTKKYYETIEYLKSQIEMEENVYRKYCLNYKDAHSLAIIVKKELFNKNELGSLKSLTAENNSILNGKFDDALERRILYKLIEYMGKDTNGTLNQIINKEPVLAILSNIDPSIENELEKTSLISSSIKYDTYILVLKYLEEYINNDKYKSIRNTLIKIKYNILYTKTITEYSLINNSFNIPKDITLTSKLVCEYNNDNYQMYIDVLLADNVINIMNDIASLDNERINNTEDINTIMKICFFKAYITLLSEEIIEALESGYIEYINKPEYKKYCYNFKITEDIIFSILNNSKEYKQNINRFTLKPY